MEKEKEENSLKAIFFKKITTHSLTSFLPF
jgi:hypothetical protein